MFPIGDENEHTGLAFVTITLIVLNVVAFLNEINRPAEAVQAFIFAWGVVPREVWVNDVGTRPAWRGCGAARAVLTSALAAAAAAGDGFERAILGVDRDNPTGAVRLYRSLGFDDVRASVVLARRL